MVKFVKRLTAEERFVQAGRQSDHTPCHPYANVTVTCMYPCILTFHEAQALQANLVFLFPLLLCLFGTGRRLLALDTQRRTIVVSRYRRVQMLFNRDINQLV